MTRVQTTLNPKAPTRRFRAFSVLLVAALMACCFSGTSVAAGVKDDSRSWLALGDSFSAGEGIPGTTTELDAQGKNCSRATGTLGGGKRSDAKAWAVVAYDELRNEFGSQDFVACTGAINDDLSQQVAEARRSGRQSWDLVTFSFGGNNVKFSGILTGCLDVNNKWDLVDLTPGCDIDLQTAKARVDMLTGRRPIQPDEYSGTKDWTLPQLYDQAASLVKPGGHVIVAGYPQLLEEVGRWGFWRQGLSCHSIWRYDIGMLRSVDAYLNAQIEEAVRAADSRWATRGVHFTFADFANKVYETEGGRHGLCTGDEWLNGVTLGVTAGDFRKDRSFHPKQAGHTASGHYVASLVKTFSWEKPVAAAEFLYDHYVSTDAVGPSGVRRSFAAGANRSDDSTSFWIGCGGSAASTVFGVPPGLSGFRTTFTLDPAITPVGLNVQVTLFADGVSLGEWQLRTGDAIPVNVNLKSGSRLTLTATARGNCRNSAIGYGVAVDGQFTEGSAADTATTGSELPSSYVGEWTGEIEQYNVSTWTADLVLTGGQVGSKVGTSAYPTLDCSGTLELLEIRSDSILLQEVIQDQGSRRGCLSPVLISLQPVVGGTMEYSDGGGSAFLGTLIKKS